MVGKTLILGTRGLAGSAIARRFPDAVHISGRNQWDLRVQQDVRELFSQTRPDNVVLAAGRVGGIQANADAQWDFAYDNLIIAANVISSCVESGVRRVVYLGSSCIYPREAPQPLREEYLLTGPFEPTNRGYAVAKLAGIELCRAAMTQHPDRTRFTCVIPTNLYGPGDNYAESGHVFAAWVRRFTDAAIQGAPSITLWGSGAPRREFLHADDLARAVERILSEPEPPFLVNVGWGQDIELRELAQLFAQATGFRGEIVWDRSRPDGTPRKLLAVSRLTRLGWAPSITLQEGIARSVTEYHSLAL